MKAKLIGMIHNPDGSADAKFEMDQEALHFFAGKGINAALKEFIEELERNEKNLKKKKNTK